eukprot:m.144157 g.144157  ORF g.144157 m.144157 type:complete len:275 (-) comp14911_c0_seq2:2356-3180(-)
MKQPDSSLSLAQTVTEKFILFFTPIWTSVVAGIVYTEVYTSFSPEDYVLLGVTLSLPCILGPLLTLKLYHGVNVFHSKNLYWLKYNLYCGVLMFQGSYFITHYFYTVLGARYTVPTGDGRWEFNNVPICMYLLAHPYFCTYHVIAERIINFSQLQGMFNVLLILLLAFITAILETLSIEAFPHYNYPDRDAFLTKGSAFYSIFFVFSYPMYVELAKNGQTWSLWHTVVHSMGCAMLIMTTMDFWRLFLGPISPLVNSSLCPPFTHPVVGVALPS